MCSRSWHKRKIHITYNPRNPPIHTIIEQNAQYLITKKFPLKLEDIQIVYRKANNLRDLLVSGNTSEKPAPKHNSSPCRKCITCERIEPSNDVTASTKENFKIRGTFNCQSTNYIYALTCNHCKLKYIVESSQTINQRFRTHESHIKSQHSSLVAQHFTEEKLDAKSYTSQILDHKQNKNSRLRLEES